MGASQSSQPPSRHNSRHDKAVSPSTDTSKHKQKAASVSSPLKPTLPVIIDSAPKPVIPPLAVAASAPVDVVQPAPAVAMPIPVKKKPVSLPTSGENSYVDQNKDVELLHRLEELKMKELAEELNEEDVQSKFGIAWAASDEFDDDVDKHYRGMSCTDRVDDSCKVSTYDYMAIWWTRGLCSRHLYREKGIGNEKDVCTRMAGLIAGTELSRLR
jgi:hypothetical protein